MSAGFICHACGQKLTVPEGHTRNKMRCTHCGVICDIPASARAPAPDEAPPAKRPAPRAEPAPPPAPREAPPPEKGLVTCDTCGELVRAPTGKRRAAECPNCGAPIAKATPPPRETPRPKPAPKSAPPPPPQEDVPRLALEEDDEDDGRPYIVTGAGDEKKCPHCHKTIPTEAVICVGCGTNLETGEKLTKTYEKVERHWEGGLPLATRRNLYFGILGAAFFLGLAGAIALEAVCGFFFTWLVLAAMLGFLLGTFERIDLERNTRGQVKLTKTWRYFFLPQPPKTYRLSEYESLYTGRVNEHDFWDWIVFFILLGWGLIPGAVWWYCVFYRDTFFVALCQDHGYPAEPLYRGFNKDHVQEIARTLSNVTTLPCEGF